MLEEIINVVFLILEFSVLIFFSFYIIKYYKKYQEKVDPYTKATLTLLSLSFLFQFLRIPIEFIEMAHNND